VTFVERRGASILVEDARAVVALAQRGPVVARRPVVVLGDVQLGGPAAPVLLKTLEEPPETTVFVVLAEAVTPALVTIASRCVEVEFTALDASSIEDVLASEGVERDQAAAAAACAGGRLDRARLLGDSGFADRQQAWRSVPSRLDGTGSTVAVLVDELLASADEIVEVVRARQSQELAELTAAAERAGERHLPGRAAIEERHKREQRRARVDELRAGFAALAGVYRSRLVGDGRPARQLSRPAAAVRAVDAAAAALTRNPNEALLLQGLLLALDETSS
jgi:DNA polymerase-3 subunit delta'